MCKSLCGLCFRFSGVILSDRCVSSFPRNHLNSHQDPDEPRCFVSVPDLGCAVCSSADTLGRGGLSLPSQFASLWWLGMWTFSPVVIGRCASVMYFCKSLSPPPPRFYRPAFCLLAAQRGLQSDRCITAQPPFALGASSKEQKFFILVMVD
jgi:hypothetical protein